MSYGCPTRREKGETVQFKKRSQSRQIVMQDPSQKRLKNIVKSCENDTYLKTEKTVQKWDLISQTDMNKKHLRRQRCRTGPDVQIKGRSRLCRRGIVA